MPRLFVPPEALGAARATLEGEAHKYLSRVLRLAPGDALTLFDGEGHEIDARVEAIGSRTTTVALGARRAAQRSGATITLLQAVAKGERMDWIVQKTTELGVARVVPVLAHRSVARPEAGEGRHVRWQTIAREAARQCGRSDVPRLDAPLPLTTALADPQLGEATRLMLYEGAAGRALRTALEGSPRSVALLVGPEGGWTEEEVAMAQTQGFLAVSLGPRILRVETAAVVAVTLAQAAVGGLDP
jgi:16S rRNA (uracil1498-N3)-methyltransferase